MQSRLHAKYFFLRIEVGSFDGLRDFNADLCKNIETTSVCSIAFNQKSAVVVFFFFGGGEGDFWEGAVFRGRHKGFFGEVGGGNKVVCLKTRTLLTCLLGKKSDLVEFFLGGEGSFLGRDKEVFSGGE